MTDLTLRQRVLVFLDSFEKLEYKRKIEIVRLFSSPEELFSGADKIAKFFEKNGDYNSVAAVVEALKRPDTADEMINSSLAFADGVVCLGDEDYPEELKNTPVPPIVLYYKGNKDLLKSGRTRTGMVGSRKTLPSYLELAKTVSESVSSSGEIVVTGIAVGADTAAINGAIKSGNIISVFAGGIDCVYPRTQTNIAQAEAKSGLIITEYPAKTTPKNYTYPVRNRIIAGLSRAVLIVSGDDKSGARYTANYAADYGREVLAFPYAPNVSYGELCNGLIKQGATLVENAEDVCGILGIDKKEKQAISLEGNEAIVYESINRGVCSPDKIIEETGLKPYEISVAISMLELKGAIVRNGSEYEITR